MFTPVFVCARNAHVGSRCLPFPSVCALPAGSRHKDPHCHPSAPKRVRQTGKQPDICIFAKFPQYWLNKTFPGDAPHQILNSTTSRLLFLFYRSDPAVQTAMLNFDGKKIQFDSNLQFIASISSGLRDPPAETPLPRLTFLHDIRMWENIIGTWRFIVICHFCNLIEPETNKKKRHINCQVGAEN